MSGGPWVIVWLVGAILAALVSSPAPARAAEVAVRQAEGVTRGFLVLRTPGGGVLADGDLLQTTKADGVHSRLTFRFRDGSLFDETVVFSQRRVFTMLRYLLEQRGPSFPGELKVSLERSGGRGRYTVTSRPHGEETERASGETEMPPDVYNGMTIMLLRNLAGAAETVHTLAFTPAPILVQLELAPHGEEPVSVGERRVAALHYVLTPKLGVVRGAVAAVLGKTPSDYHCWIVTAGLPAFVAIDGPLFAGGPIWRVETVSPRSPGRAEAR